MLVLHWLIVFAALSGLGSFWNREDVDPQYAVFDAFWSGLFMAAVLLELLHLFEPDRPEFALALVTFGLIGAVVNRRALLRARIPTLAIPLIAVFGLWTTMAALNEPPQWDFGLYHLPALRWAQAYAVVPGLANLSWPLGHNSSFVSLAAAFDDSRLTGIQPWQIIAPLLVLTIAAEGSIACVSLARGSVYKTSDAFRAFGIAFAAAFIGNWLPTLSPDVAVAMVGYAAVSRFAACAVDVTDVSSVLPLRSVLVLASLGITLKLTSAPYFATLGIAAIVGCPARMRTWRVIGPVALPAALLAAAWIANGIILSGYPFYPAPVLPFPTSWTVPIEVVRQRASETLWHTRGAGWTPQTHWIENWLRRVVWTAGKIQVVLPASLGLFTAVWLLIRRQLTGARTLLFLLPAVLGIVVWFFAAPEPRFAGAIFWHAGIGLVALAMADGRVAVGRARAAICSMAAAFVALYLVLGARAMQLPAPWHPAALPHAPRTLRVTLASQLEVYEPVDDERCLDAPLPCSPQPDVHLRLRRGGDLAAGFATSP